MKSKKLFFKKCASCLLSLVLVGALVGCGDSSDSSKGKDSKASATEEKDKGPKTYKVGDTVTLKNYKMKVNKIYTVKPSEFAKPAKGNEFFAIDCTIENISKEKQSVSSMLMFKVVDGDGRACEYSLTGQTAAKAGQLDGDIAPGKKLTGVYTVEVPTGKKGLELIFEGDMLKDEQATVKLR